jgi:hypothetical protein
MSYDPTSTLDEMSITLELLESEIDKFLLDISTFNVETQTPEELHILFQKHDKLKESISDNMIALEVEDFLTHGSRIKNKNI